MTKENTQKLIEFLKSKNEAVEAVLFYDQIKDKRLDLFVWFSLSDNDIYIYGDDSQLYEFSELELIDEVVLINNIP